MTAPKQKFYDIVAEEIRSRFVVDGLWVRSFSEAGGEETKARAIYISYRVEQLQAEEAAARGKRVSPAYHRFLAACFFVFVRALLIPLIP